MITFNDSRFKNYIDKIEENINLIIEDIGDEAEIILADHFIHLPNFGGNFSQLFDLNDKKNTHSQDFDENIKEEPVEIIFHK